MAKTFATGLILLPLASLPTASSTYANQIQATATNIYYCDGTKWNSLIPSFTSAAPTATSGLTAVAGTATTYMTSDSAPAINQSIAPTWTGAHTFAAQAQFTASVDAILLKATNVSALGLRFTNTPSSSSAYNSTTRVYVDNAGGFIIAAVSDDLSTAKVAYSYYKSGTSSSTTTISQAYYGNSTDLPQHSFYGPLRINSSSSTYGLTIIAPAGTSTTGISFLQSGQNGWLFYNPASSADFLFYSGTFGNFARFTAASGLATFYGGLSVSGAATFASTVGVTGTATFTNATAAIIVSGGTPIIRWQATGGAKDGTLIQAQPDANGNFYIQLVNDAATTGKPAITINRSANAITSMAYGNSTDIPAHVFYGNVTMPNGLAVTNQGGIGVSGPAATQDNFFTCGQANQYTWQLYGPASSNDLHWYNNGVGDVMVYGGNGNVGIGTVPDSKFQVQSTTASSSTGAGLRIGYQNASTNYYDADYHNFRDHTQSNALMYSLSSSSLTQTTNSAAYAASANNVVGIRLNNTSSSMQTALEFQLNGTVNGRVRSDYLGNLSYVTAQSGAHYWWCSGDSGSGTNRMTLSNAGALTVNGTAVSSDIDLKENLSPISHALDFIQSLRGVRFTWKENGEKSAGLIAQDVEALMPELVLPGLNDSKALNYNGIVGCLVAAMQEQQAQIERLTQLVAAAKE